MPAAPTWETEDRCVVDGTVFQTLPVDLLEQEKPSFSMKGADFLLLKERPLVERHVELIQALDPRNVVELGVYEGGSTAFLFQVAAPRRLVAVDLKPPNNPTLPDFVARRGLEDDLRVFYDVDQADRPRLATILADAFGDEPLDLVVDDCSHLYEPTRASFNELFPRLREGGVYVIEDWTWAHAPGAGPEGMWPDEVPLTRLIFEIVLALPSIEGLIADIKMDQWSVRVTRGDAQVEAEGFDISACSNPRGRRMLAG